MKELKSLGELYFTDFNLSRVVAMNQNWGKNSSFSMKNPRPTNALMYFEGGTADFYDKALDRVVHIPRGSIFFIPQGSVYDWTFYDTEKGSISNMLLEFCIDDITVGEGAKILSADLTSAKAIFRRLVELFSMPQPSPASVKSEVYRLLYTVLEGERHRTLKGSVGCIYRGIRYLEEDPKQELSIDEVAALCNVSTNYFERLFKEYSGMTPVAYRIKRRMERAGVLLMSGGMTVSAVSRELGFEDSAYFCRAFKKHYGCTPSEYKG